MVILRKYLTSSPLLVRTIPFIVFLLLTAIQGQFGEQGKFWIYLAKCVVGFILLYLTWSSVPEMRWRITPRAVGVGVLVCALWVGLDSFYPKLGGVGAIHWNPFSTFGEGANLAWFFFVIRVVGSSLIVPPLEEVFYRSFLYRYVANKDYSNVPLLGFRWMPFFVTSLLFGFAHSQWLPGILCGLCFQWLVCRSGTLGESMVAHAITNFLLAIWILTKGAWTFW